MTQWCIEVAVFERLALNEMRATNALSATGPEPMLEDPAWAEAQAKAAAYAKGKD